jgi:hypothetical protein
VALAIPSYIICSGDRRGEGSGPIHGSMFHFRLLTQTSTILFEMDPSCNFVHTLEEEDVGVSSSDSALNMSSIEKPAWRVSSL